MSHSSSRARRWRRQQSIPSSKLRFRARAFEQLEDRRLLAGENLAFLEADGTLRLNMGTFVGGADPNNRQIETSTINENYIVEHVSGSPTAPGGETVNVIAFNVTETHSGVKSIFADADAGDDSIDLRDTLAPSELHGGAGSDILTTGHGASSLFGDAGNDFLFVGSGDLNEQAHVTASGGADLDHITVSDDGLLAGTTDQPNEQLVDYDVSSIAVTSTNSAGAPSGQAARTFGGLTFDNTSEFLRLNATDGRNTIVVHPSLKTQFYIDGNAPITGLVDANQGDYLQLDTTGTTGRKITSTGFGAGTWTFTDGHQQIGFENIEQFNHVTWMAVASDAGTKGKTKPRVQMIDVETKQVLFEIDPTKTFGINSFYGVHLAAGDVDGDGYEDVVVASGKGAAPDVKVFAGMPLAGQQGSLMFDIVPSLTYGASFKGGVNVAVGDVTGDTKNDIVIAPATGVPTIKVFENEPLTADTNILIQTRSFNAFSDIKGYIGGASIAIGDFDGVVGTDGDKHSEIVVGTGAGVKARWRIFNTQGATQTIVRTVMDPSGLNTGIFVAAGDVDGDGIAEVATSTAAGGNSWVRVYRATGTQLNSFRAFTAAADKPNAAVHITMRDVNGDGRAEILATQGQDGRSQYKIKEFAPLTGALVDSLVANSPDFFGGGLYLG